MSDALFGAASRVSRCQPFVTVAVGDVFAAICADGQQPWATFLRGTVVQRLLVLAKNFHCTKKAMFLPKNWR